MKIGLVSYRSENKNIPFNLTQIERALKETQGQAELLCFGEAFLQGFDSLCWDYETDRQMAVDQNSETMDYLRGLEKPALLSDGKGGQRTGQELPSCRILRFQCKYLLSARLYDMVEASVIPGASKEDAQLFRFRIADARGRRLFAAGLLEVRVGNR